MRQINNIMFMKCFVSHLTEAKISFQGFCVQVIDWQVLPGERRRQGRTTEKGQERGKGGDLGNLDPAGSFGVLIMSEFVSFQGKL